MRVLRGIEAERLLFDDVSTGASGFGHPSSDLSKGTKIAEAIVELCGMGDGTGLRMFRDQKGEREVLSGMMAEKIDKTVNALIAEAQSRAATILREHKDDLLRLRDEVRAKKVLERDRVQQIVAEFKDREAARKMKKS